MYKEEFNPSQFMTERYFEFHQSYNETPPTVEFHQHPFYEIFFFLSGNVNYIIEGKNYSLRPGDILLTGSLDIHRPDIHAGKPYERIVIWLADDFFGHLKELRRRSDCLFYRCRGKRLSSDPAGQSAYRPAEKAMQPHIRSQAKQRTRQLCAGLRLSDRIARADQPRLL